MRIFEVTLNACQSLPKGGQGLGGRMDTTTKLLDAAEFGVRRGGCNAVSFRDTAATGSGLQTQKQPQQAGAD